MPKLSRSELANLAVGLPIVTAIIGLLVGVGGGFAVGWGLKPNAGPTDEQIARLTLDAFSPDQIEFKCGQVRGEELKSANERIAALETERNDYERKVMELEAQLDTQRPKTPSSKGGSGAKASSKRAAELEGAVLSLQRELNAARNQLATVSRQLFEAEEQKRQLQDALVATSTQLRNTQTQLAVQVSETEVAKKDALSQKWWRFLADSQLEICEKGNRKKLGHCRETVQLELKTNAVRNKFMHCVRSGAAVPAVGYLGKADSMPRFADFIDQDERIVRDWYVQLCDPTLPEATLAGASSLVP